MSPHRMTRRATLAALATMAVGATALQGCFQKRGRSVAIIGAGVAGLTSAYYLSRAGFEVTVLEAEARYGGRSLTVRPQSDAYRRYFRDRYGIDKETYVDRFAERDGPEQVCAFYDDGWDPDTEEYPEELYLNAGPGRIPSFHIAVLELCREIGVELEPFIFASRSNLVQADGFNDGKPVQLRRVKHDLRGYLAEMLAALVGDGAANQHLSAEALGQMSDFLKEFGKLTPSGNSLRYQGSNRAGYSVFPGAWRHPGELNPVFKFEDMLASGVWDGSVYNNMRIYWQTSMMQPKGGMDMIWQRLLRQSAGEADSVRDLVRLGAPVSSIKNAGDDGGVEVTWGGRESDTEVFDYCVSTMAPNLLSKVLKGFPDQFVKALKDVEQVAACKVGWQGQTRFWEQDDQIFGGISWTKHEISQIWYPSDGYLGRTGTLTGAYIRGNAAKKFGRLSQAERLEIALEGGEKLHPGFRDKVYTDRGISIAWEKMPHQVAGWAKVPDDQPNGVYETITDLPQGQLYLAGDFVSYTPGWMEGAVRSARLASDAIEKHAGETADKRAAQ